VKLTVPALALRSWPWASLAACRDTDIDYFVEGKSAAVMREVARAKALCATCPVHSACLQVGMGERYGVWAGLTPPERRRLRKRSQAAA
jgi:WhiB family redox-sensing transcriptional regulator